MTKKIVKFNSGARLTEECSCGCDAFNITEWASEAKAVVRCASCNKQHATYSTKVKI